ncbi:ATP-binding cassette domain-containing protein [Actibacterium sp. D379-3]
MYGTLSRGEVVWPLAFVAVAMVLPLYLNNYLLYVGCTLMVYAVLALGLDVIMGHAGQFAFSHVAFYGIGAYLTAILQDRFGIPFPAGLLLAVLVCAGLAALVAVASVRLRHIYLGLATVAFASAVNWGFQTWKAATGGVDGLRVHPSEFILFTSNSDASNFRVLAVIFAVMLLATFLLLRSHLGRSMAAIRDSEHVAAVSGISVRRTKLWAFVISSVYAGVAGGMLVVFNSFISPENFTFAPAVLLLTMLVVGGMGTVPGVILGAVILGLLPEVLRAVMKDFLVWQEFVYGLILVLSITLMPQGVYGALRGLTALDRLSLEVEQGTIHALIGPNGAGKSTAFNAITRVYNLSAGRVRFDDQVISTLPPHSLAGRGLSRTFQNIELCGRMTVLENVLVGMSTRIPRYIPLLPGRSRSRAEAAALHEAEALLERMGLSEVRDTKAGALDFGRQKMLDIVRALASKPRLLLLDEPAAGLRNREIAALDALLGANGAGKSTTLNCISGLVPLRGGAIRFEGERIDGLSPEEIVRRGIAQVPEGREIFPDMSVADNLLLGGWIHRGDRRQLRHDQEHIYDIFPRLKEREQQHAGTLSGGEQQMLMIGRALMSRPRLLLMDEPSLGLSPVLVKTLFDVIVRLNRDGLTTLIVEQNAELALTVSQYGYILENGEMAFHGPSGQLHSDDRIRDAYLGT